MAYIIADFVFASFKSKRSTKLFLYGYSICLVGALTIVLNDVEKYPAIDMIGQFICKFGIASAFQACYLANVLFPTAFSSSTFGVCVMMNSLASFCSVFIIYDFETKDPWYVYIGCCCLGMICSYLLRDNQ
jgi:hypothetical protein